MSKPILFGAVLAAAGILNAGAADKVDFAKEILPTLQECIKCHGPEKQKGKMRLDSRDAALKGGKTGPAFVAGDAAKSEMVRRISLPKSDDDFMPSEGEPLSKEKIDLIKKWIDEGAEWPATATAASDKPGATAKAPPPGPVLPADFKPSGAEQKAIAAFAAKGMDIRPIAMNSPWREANLRLHGSNVTDATLAPIKDVLGLIDLNLATTKVTDAGLAHLKPLANLQRLHLELTGVTDAGLAQLKGLKNLTYLNLYGTKVTDAGLDQLKGLKHLRNLYVWQTKVTDAGAKKLKSALPDVDVSMGWDASTLAKMEAKKEEKKDEKPAEAKKDEKKEEKKAEVKKEEKETKPTEAKKEEKKADTTAEKKEEKKADAPAEKKEDKKADAKEEKKN
ncbi:MAG TPA: c-type cytochrome domain-containing protein [Verrucomicrobiae bacterium]|nr:c-type cytochrome domain-containing protein [Verrucomicrobiae bacterium]